jgi:UV DNA damage endonuclease
VRLGFPVKILGQPELKSHDTRRWQNHPHLSVSLAYLRDIFLYLDRQDIRMYRMAADLAPYASHPDLQQFHSQVGECTRELAELGRMADAFDLRLSFHLPAAVVLNALDENIARQAARQIKIHTSILDGLGLGREAVVVGHVGGLYGDKDKALARFVECYRRLPSRARRRLVLENDDGRFSVADTLWIHQETGIPLVFDFLHFQNHNPEGMSTAEALEHCLLSWPPGIKPKVHFSSPRTAMRLLEPKAGNRRTARRLLRAPRPRQHADFADPFRFCSFVRQAMMQELPDFDVMLEAKAKDLALLHLREQVARFACDITVR